jgi:predicted porin
MAQVTVSGVFDISAVANGKVSTQAGSGATATTNVKTSATGANAGYTTSQIVFTASEDLGNGMKATGVIVQDMRSNGFTERDHHVTLSGGFGSVRMGRFTPAAGIGQYLFGGAASANAVGSTYGLSTTATNSAFSSGLAAGSFERQNNVLQYTSPTISGLTVALVYANNTSDSDAAADTSKAKVNQTGLNIAYSAGPLSIAAGTSDRKVDREARAALLGFKVDTTGAIGSAVTIPTGATADTQFDAIALTSQSVKGGLDYIGASYDLGVAKISGTHAKRKDTTTSNVGVTTTNADITLNAFGVTVPMGKITVSASMYSGKDKRAAGNTDDMKLSGHQITALYAFSKRTNAYVAMGENKMARDGAASTQATRKVTGSSVGLTHAF